MEMKPGEPPRAPSPAIRVVVFGAGPSLSLDSKQLLVRLNTHTDIKLMCAIFQSPPPSFRARVLDVWNRRRWMALPLLLLQCLAHAGEWIRAPRAVWKIHRDFQKVYPLIVFTPDIHDPSVLDRVREVQPDLGLIYGSPILKESLFSIPSLGTLGIHHGKVPEYRGKKATFWAMYNGERAAGVTIQKINAGIDTGQIVNEGLVVTAGRSYGRVQREVIQRGLDLYIESVLQVHSSTAVYKPQVGEKGKLYRDPSFSDIIRFWCIRLRRIQQKQT